MKKVIVIGAGIGGLAAAALLGKYGFEVVVLEKNKSLGGRAMQFQHDGYRFDMGPSWYLMPEVFERYYGLFNEKPTNFFQLTKLSPSYRIFFDTDDVVDVPADKEKVLQLFEKLERGSGEKIRDYLQKAEYQYQVAMDKLLYQSYDSWKDVLKPELVEGAKMNVFQNLEDYTSRFTQNDRIKKILQYNNVFLGSSPKNTPAMYSMMSYIDFAQGVYYPSGGIYSIVESLISLCKRFKVTIQPDSEVIGIDFDGMCPIVRTNRQDYKTDIVVSNADYHHTETTLLQSHHRTYPDSYWKKKTIAPSAFLMYLGLKKKINKLKHHTLVLVNDWQKHFDQIFADPQWPEKPSYYVCVPSKTDKSVAPKGKENVFILVPIASNLEDTPKIRNIFSKKILKHFEEVLQEDIQSLIEFQRIQTINDYKSLYNSYKGTALGLSHTLLQTAIFRPNMKSKKLNNLYYVGQYTHPGIGMPMCLISAEVVSNLINKDVKG